MVKSSLGGWELLSLPVSRHTVPGSCSRDGLGKGSASTRGQGGSGTLEKELSCALELQGLCGVPTGAHPPASSGSQPPDARVIRSRVIFRSYSLFCGSLISLLVDLRLPALPWGSIVWKTPPSPGCHAASKPVLVLFDLEWPQRGFPRCWCVLGQDRHLLAEQGADYSKDTL